MSHSAAKDMKTCWEMNYLKRVAKIYPKQKGSSLAFGIAVDRSLCHLLEAVQVGEKDRGLEEYLSVFHSSDDGWDQHFDSEKLCYRDADHDYKVFLPEDHELIKSWEEELGVTGEESFQTKKQRKYKDFTETHQHMINRLSWLSLKRKGPLMLESFVREVLPKIKKVIAVQHKIEGDIGEHAIVVGYIDLICEYEGYDKPIVFDIKTSASLYDADKATQFGEQLVLYLSAVGEELDTELVGYIVLLKFMKVDSECSKCGAKKESLHKTCNEEVEGVRCKGEWKNSYPTAQTQVLVDKISKMRQNVFMKSFEALSVLAKEKPRVQNWDACHNYGRCDYFDLCHFGKKELYNFPKEND